MFTNFVASNITIAAVGNRTYTNLNGTIKISAKLLKAYGIATGLSVKSVVTGKVMLDFKEMTGVHWYSFKNMC